MKNNTLHKLLKEFQDKWLQAEKDVIQGKIDFARMAIKIPENREKLGDYVEIDVQKLFDDLVERNKQMSEKRRHIMEEFPIVRS